MKKLDCKRKFLIIICFIFTYVLLMPKEVGALTLNNDKSFKELIESAKKIQSDLLSLSIKEKVMEKQNVKQGVTEALNTAKKYAQNLLEKGEIENFTVNDNSVVINHKVGVTLIFTPIVEGTYSGIDNDKTISVYTIQPWYSHSEEAKGDSKIKLPEGIDNQALLLPGAANLITDEFLNSIYDKSLKERELNLEDIKAIGQNQIVLWQGHGTWVNNDIHSVLWTKNYFDWEKFEKDPEYRNDCNEKRIVSADGNEAITSKYIDKYANDMTNTFIYLGPCESGVDYVLAQSFLNKNAAAVIGNTNVIQAIYGDIMEYTTVKLLTEINPLTNKHYTLKDALNKAKDIYGEDDSVLYPFATGAAPVIFGDENYYINYSTPIDSNNVFLDCSEYIYDGKEKRPNIKVLHNKKILTEEVDYNVEYKNNISEGEASVIIKLKGNYTGIIEKKFLIKPVNPDTSDKSNVTIWTLILFISLSGIISCFNLTKHQN